RRSKTSTPRRRVDVFDLRAFVHRVEYFLRSTLRADPHRMPTRPLERWDRVALQDEIDAIQTLERYLDILGFHQLGKALSPARFQAEDVVGKPDVVGLHHFFEIFKLGYHVFRAAD